MLTGSNFHHNLTCFSYFLIFQQARRQTDCKSWERERERERERSHILSSWKQLGFIHLYCLLTPNRLKLTVFKNNFHYWKIYFVHGFPDSKSFFGPTLTFFWHWCWPNNFVDAPSFFSSGRRNCQWLVRCWPNIFSSTSPAYANVMLTFLFHVANVGLM